MSLLELFFHFCGLFLDFLLKNIFYPFTDEYFFCDMSSEDGIDGKTSLLSASPSYYSVIVPGEPLWIDNTLATISTGKASCEYSGVI